MKIEAETVSSVLAKLVTNPSYVEKHIKNYSELLSSFQLSTKDKDQLKSFFDKYSKQFAASTRLLRKRRWDNIKDSLQLLTKVFPVVSLDNFWSAYIESLSLNKNVPKNPLIESVLFCEFILDTQTLTSVESVLVQYEKIRNQAIVNFSTDFTDYTSSQHFKAIHPCYATQEFPCNVSALVKAINQGLNLDEVNALYKKQSELILFYKNWKKDGVATVKINHAVHQFVELYNKLLPVLVGCGVIQERGITS